MPYSPLGFFAGFGIARSTDPALEGSQAAKVAVIPGILGLNIASLLIAKVVADQEAESLEPPVPQNPAIAVDPASHDYGKVNVKASASQTFVVSNTGNAELAVNATALSGTDRGRFIVSGGAPFTLAPGATRNVEVSFTPDSAGAKSASLDITSSDPVRPFNIALSGTGVAPAIEVIPAIDHNYGSIKIDSSACKIFVVKNTGTAELVVTETTLSGPNADRNADRFDIVTGEIISGNPLKVLPGETHFVEVTFTPDSDDEKKASLVIESNDPVRPTLSIELIGNRVSVPAGFTR